MHLGEETGAKGLQKSKEEAGSGEAGEGMTWSDSHLLLLHEILHLVLKKAAVNFLAIVT